MKRLLVFALFIIAFFIASCETAERRGDGPERSYPTSPMRGY